MGAKFENGPCSEEILQFDDSQSELGKSYQQLFSSLAPPVEYIPQKYPMRPEYL